MKLNRSHYILLSILIVLLLISSSSFGQGFSDIGFEEDVNDEAAAPINGLIALAMAVGGYLGVKKLKK